MPLHDWTELIGWDGVHHFWITELVRSIKPRLPEGYRAFVGSAPVLALGTTGKRPDVSVREWLTEESVAPEAATSAADEQLEPDEEIAVATMEPGAAVFVERHGRLVSVVELISPRNKDRPESRETYLSRYVGYILNGVHLVLVDVHPRPRGFSFADAVAASLEIAQPPCAPPIAVSYRVGEPAASGGRLLAIWRRPLSTGAALPTLPLPLNVHQSVTLDLESTYVRAAADAYIV